MNSSFHCGCCSLSVLLILSSGMESSGIWSSANNTFARAIFSTLRVFVYSDRASVPQPTLHFQGQPKGACRQHPSRCLDLFSYRIGAHDNDSRMNRRPEPCTGGRSFV